MTSAGGVGEGRHGIGGREIVSRPLPASSVRLRGGGRLLGTGSGGGTIGIECLVFPEIPGN